MASNFKRGDVLNAVKLRGLQAQGSAIDDLLRQLKYEVDPAQALTLILDKVTAILERENGSSKQGGTGSGRFVHAAIPATVRRRTQQKCSSAIYCRLHHGHRGAREAGGGGGNP